MGTGGVTDIESPLRDDIVSISDLINVLLQFLLPVAIAILFLMFVYAGYMYLTSQGDPGKVKEASAIITSTIIGAFLLVVAFLVVRIIGYIFGFSGGILGL